MAALSSLLVHGVVGTYTHFEATEVFAVRDGQDQAINALAETYSSGEAEPRNRSNGIAPMPARNSAPETPQIALPTLRFEVPEAAQILRMSRAQLYNRIHEGSLRAQKDGARTYITRGELERYVESCGA